MRRVAIIGSTGSGKSTVARRLGHGLGLPVVHLDTLYYRPGWEPTPADEWGRMQQELVQRDAWIIDGNYKGTLPIRLRAADTVVFLDLPRAVCLGRVLWRRLRYLGRTQPYMTAGCPERFDRNTLQFLRYTWRYPERTRPEVLALLEEHAAHAQLIRLTTGGDVEAFLSAAAPVRPRVAARVGM